MQAPWGLGISNVSGQSLSFWDKGSGRYTGIHKSLVRKIGGLPPFSKGPKLSKNLTNQCDFKSCSGRKIDAFSGEGGGESVKFWDKSAIRMEPGRLTDTFVLMRRALPDTLPIPKHTGAINTGLGVPHLKKACASLFHSSKRLG